MRVHLKHLGEFMRNIWRKGVAFFIRNAKLLLGLFFVAAVPLILFSVIYSNISALSGCFNPISDSSVSVTQQVSTMLSEAHRTISVLNPPVQFYDDWLFYDIIIQNKSKAGFAFQRSNGEITNYEEAVMNLLVQTDQGFTVIPYGESRVVSSKVPLSAVSNYPVGISSRFGVDDWNARFDAGEEVSPQLNINLGGTCLYLNLNTSPQLLLIYIQCWVVTMGVVLLLRESLVLCLKGPAYFISR